MRLAPRIASITVLAVLPLAATIAAAAGKPSLNVYFQSTLKDDAYQKKTFEKTVKAWKTPKASAFPKVGTKTVVRAVFTKEGKLVSTEVSTQSGSKPWDDAALAMVKAAAPLDPLPASYGYPSIEVHFHVSVVP